MTGVPLYLRHLGRSTGETCDIHAEYVSLGFDRILVCERQVGASFALTLGLTAAEACIIAARPDMGNMAAVGYLFMRILAYPLVHFWSNLACLQVSIGSYLVTDLADASCLV